MCLSFSALDTSHFQVGYGLRLRAAGAVSCAPGPFGKQPYSFVF
jgi:hypothetical protein